MNTPSAESNGSLYVWKPNGSKWPEPVTGAAESKSDLAARANMMGLYNEVPGTFWKIDVSGRMMAAWTTETHGYDAGRGPLDGLLYRAAKLVPGKMQKPAGK